MEHLCIGCNVPCDCAQEECVLCWACAEEAHELDLDLDEIKEEIEEFIPEDEGDEK